MGYKPYQTRTKEYPFSEIFKVKQLKHNDCFCLTVSSNKYLTLISTGFIEKKINRYSKKLVSCSKLLSVKVQFGQYYAFNISVLRSYSCSNEEVGEREKGRDLTQSYDKSPYTNRNVIQIQRGQTGANKDTCS